MSLTRVQTGQTVKLLEIFATKLTVEAVGYDVMHAMT